MSFWGRVFRPPGMWQRELYAGPPLLCGRLWAVWQSGRVFPPHGMWQRELSGGPPSPMWRAVGCVAELTVGFVPARSMCLQLLASPYVGGTSSALRA